MKNLISARILTCLLICCALVSFARAQTKEEKAAASIAGWQKSIDRSTDPYVLSEAYFRIGYIRYQIQKYDEAMVDLQKSLEYAAKVTNSRKNALLRASYHQLGMVYLRRDNPSAAIKNFTQAIALSESFDSFHFRGHAYLSDKNPTAAVTDFSKAIEEKMTEYDEGEDYDPAKYPSEFDKFDINDDGVYDDRDAKLIRYGIKLRAENAVERTALRKTLADLHSDRADAHFGLKRYSDAESDASKALSFDATFVRALYRRGSAKAYGSPARYGDALSDLNKALQIQPAHLQALNSRGEVYELKGEFEAAIRDYDSVLKVVPKDALLLTRRGVSNFKLGRIAPALADLNLAEENGAKSAELYAYKARIYFVQDNFVQALTVINKAVAVDPSAANYELRASIHCASGKKPLAAADERKVAVLGGKISQPCQ